MKKLGALLLCAAVIFLSLALSGCEQSVIKVESVTNLVSDFSGERVITIRFPLTDDIDAVREQIEKDLPVQNTGGVSFRYEGVTETGYSFTLQFSFSDKSEYENQIAAFIGREPQVFLSKKDTVLTKGVRMSEDFSSENIVSWLKNIVAASSISSEFNFDTNSVTVLGESFNTGSKTDINTLQGSAVSSISIDTTNSKSDRYDRTVTFSIPNTTYQKNTGEIEQYFLTNTAPESEYYGWTAKGSNMEYSVIFHDLKLNQLREYTAMLLDTENEALFYGDKDHSSTPLSEGLVFEESLDTFSFVSGEGKPVPLSYSYALPPRTTHGDGSVNTGSGWKSDGSWVDGVYTAELTADAVSVRVPDGIQYAINGINFVLTSLGEGRFSRTTEFLYSTTDGYDGMKYASDFFRRRGATVEISEDENNLICAVTTEGTPGEITDTLVKLFGSGNFAAYRESESAYSLSKKTVFYDYLNMGYMLNSTNANRPMTYTVRSAGAENIVSLSIDSDEIKYPEPDAEALRVSVSGGNGVVMYQGNIPIISHIVLYSVIGLLVLALTIFIAISLLKKNNSDGPQESSGRDKGSSAKKARAEKKAKKQRRKQLKKRNKARATAQIDTDPNLVEGFENEDTAPQDEKIARAEETGEDELKQTTTFSIFELGILNRNKKYVDEINRDIEERLEKDRLENLKKEIKAEELAEMEKKVYGNPDETTEKTENQEDNNEQ